MTRACTWVLALLAVSCGSSPPTRYFTLAPIGAAQAVSDSQIPIRMGRVNLPPRLDRNSLVEWSGPGELKISGRDRWAAPLDDMIRSTLAEDLRNRLSERVYLPGDYIPAGPCRSIDLNVRSFAAHDGRRVELLADWEMTEGSPAAAIAGGSERIDVPIDSDDGSEVVPAMSQALAELSDRIVRTSTVSRLRTSRPASSNTGSE
ncbi:MAG TPA: PqiC family protein [Candidatus Binataceae bacterium]|nr:PqiC family protein [Candidatus Binataceae bacterium]